MAHTMDTEVAEKLQGLKAKAGEVGTFWSGNIHCYPRWKGRFIAQTCKREITTPHV